MKNVSRKNLVFIVLAVMAVFAIIMMAWFAPLQKSKYVHIVSDVGISQGATENNSDMETIKVHGTFWNDGNLVAKNLAAVIIFTDAAHNKIVRKNIPIGGDLPPYKGSLMEFDSEYTKLINNIKGFYMVTVAEHYDRLLARYYSWLFGAKIAIDLGSGLGFQSVALAQLGFSVYAFDHDRKLLDELKRNSAIFIPLRWSKTCLQMFTVHLRLEENLCAGK